ncbi:MAG: P-type Cu+ transporter [Thermoproteota archaeon]|nr:P-type Cu+ transporter [Thermoproteota archaeon]
MGNMDNLIAYGTSAAWIYSAFVTFFPSSFIVSRVNFDTASMIFTLVLMDRFLEHVSKGKGI